MATATVASFPLAQASSESLGLDPGRLDRLEELVESHIGDGRYPGAQLAVARGGKLARIRTFGRSAIGPASAAAVDSTPWLLYSQTKVLVTAAVWQLVDAGVLRFADKISDHIPDFARNGKKDVTLFEVLTHQGGFSPDTFGHGGAGSSYSWADPDTGVSFSYLSNSKAPEPWHSVRLDLVSNLVHASIVEP